MRESGQDRAWNQNPNQMIPSAISRLLIHSFVLTAPLTIAVAVLAYLVANKAFSHILVFGFTATIVLGGAGLPLEPRGSGPGHGLA